MKRGTVVMTGLGAVAAVAAMLVASPDADADTYSDEFAAVDWLARKYGVVVNVDMEPMEQGTYAYTVGNTIVFNSGYVGRSDLLADELVEAHLLGWMHGENCTPEQYVAAHEFGHVIDNLTGNSARAELAQALANGMTGQVSGYALTSIPEALAESVAAVECSSSTTPTERALYTMLVS